MIRSSWVILLHFKNILCQDGDSFEELRIDAYEIHAVRLNIDWIVKRWRHKLGAI